MATKTKIIKPKKTVTETPAPAATGGRKSVLVRYSATELKDLIGADTKIGVSRKELKAYLTAAAVKEAAGDL